MIKNHFQLVVRPRQAHAIPKQRVRTGILLGLLYILTSICVLPTPKAGKLLFMISACSCKILMQNEEKETKVNNAVDSCYAFASKVL